MELTFNDVTLENSVLLISFIGFLGFLYSTILFLRNFVYRIIFIDFFLSQHTIQYNLRSALILLVLTRPKYKLIGLSYPFKLKINRHIHIYIIDLTLRSVGYEINFYGFITSLFNKDLSTKLRYN